MKRIIKLLVILLFISTPLNVYSQDYDRSEIITRDSEGNIYFIPAISDHVIYNIISLYGNLNWTLFAKPWPCRDNSATDVTIDVNGSAYFVGVASINSEWNSFIEKRDITNEIIWTDRNEKNQTIALAAAVDDENNILVSGELGSGIAVIKYDSQGQELWKFNDETNIRYEQIILTKNNEAIILGYQPVEEKNRRYIHIVKIDENGEKVWSKKINIQTLEQDSDCEVWYNLPYSLRLDQDGNILFLVHVEGLPYGWQTAPRWNSHYILKYNSDGEELWRNLVPLNETTYFDEGYAFLSDIVIDEDGFIYVGSEPYVDEDNPRYVLIKYDPNGVISWTFDLNYDVPGISGIASAGPAGIYAKTTANQIVLIDPEGNMLWNVPGYSLSHSGILEVQHNAIAYGWYHSEGDEQILLFMKKINPAGEVIWELDEEIPMPENDDDTCSEIDDEDDDQQLDDDSVPSDDDDDDDDSSGCGCGC